MVSIIGTPNIQNIKEVANKIALEILKRGNGDENNECNGSATSIRADSTRSLQIQRQAIFSNNYIKSNERNNA